MKSLKCNTVHNYSSTGFCDTSQKQCRPRPAISEEGELRSAFFCTYNILEFSHLNDIIILNPTQYKDKQVN